MNKLPFKTPTMYQNNPYAGQQMIPFNQIIHPQMNVIVGNPPFIPNVMCSPNMQRLLPLVTSLLMNEITSKAMSNPLRIYMFNKYAMNGFNNPDFVELVDMVINNVEVLLIDRQAPTEDMAIQQSVTSLTTWVAAGALKENMQIQHVLNPQIVNQAQQDLQKLSFTVQRIIQHKNQLSQPQMMQVPYQGQQFSYPQTQQTQQQPLMTGGFATGNSGSMFPPPATQVSGAVSRWERLNKKNQDVIENQTHQTTSSSWRRAINSEFGSNTKTSEVPKAPAQITQPIQTDKKPVLITNSGTPAFKVGDLNWSSIPTQPYPPVYNFYRNVPLMVESEKGNMYVFLKTEAEGESIVKYDDHLIGTVIPKGVTSHSEIIEETIINKPELIPPEVSVYENNTMMFCTTEESGVVDSLLEATVHNAFETHNAYRQFLYVARPMRTEHPKECTEFVRGVSNSGTFSNASEKIKQGYLNVKTRTVARILNKLLTDELNEVLKIGLMLKAKIDDFCTDSVELDAILRNSKGNDIANALKESEGMILRRIVNIPSDDEIEGFVSSMFDSKEQIEKQLNLSWSCYSVSYTHLNYDVDQLGLAMIRKDAGLVSPELTPELYSIAKGILESENNSLFEVYKHYIRTKDEYVFEISRGLLNNKVIVIGLVDR